MRRRLLILILASFICLANALEFDASYLDQIGKQYGEYAKRRMTTWQSIIKDNQNAEELKKLQVVNQFFNLLEYRSDISQWGSEDYWATPLEFLIAGGGDCEDFTVAKYFTLLELGVPDDKLLITYVKHLQMNVAHMVLSYYPTPDSIPLILDNYNKEILPADKRTDLQPIYGFNGKGLWAAKQLGLGNKIGQASDLKRWSDLEERMKSGKIGKFRREE
ncbi:MAG TPA: transglutaminase-like cysteine peptidase [Candidatus Berkiella sp.]|nr:transglutaminase-like cysteine peptidase [Candidatus Berkiella sp.]